MKDTSRQRHSLRSEVSRRQLSVCIQAEEQLVSKQECLKTLKDFNRETARFCSLARGLGSAHDTSTLRDELRRSKSKATDLAWQNKNKLLPHLKGPSPKDDIAEYEKLWNNFSSCLELLHINIRRMLGLRKEFPVYVGTTIYIHTGLTDPLLRRKSSVTFAVDNPEHVDKATLEREENHYLEKELEQLHEMIHDVHQKVDVKPWTIEPEIDATKYEIMSETSSHLDGMPRSVFQIMASHQRRKRCLCIVAILAVLVVAVTIVSVVCAVFAL